MIHSLSNALSAASRFFFFTCLLFTLSCTAATTTDKDRQLALDIKTLGEAYLQQGNHTAALREFLEAQKVLTDDPYLYNDLGLTYMGKQRFDLAEEHFLKAISLKKDYIPAKNNLGAAYLRQEKWDNAISCYNEISEDLLYATPHFAQTNLGWAYLGKGELRLAKESFSKAIRYKPDFINALHGLATAYLKSGQPSIAEHFLLKSIQKNPDTAILHADLAESYEATNRLDKAKRSWQDVIRIDPDSSLADEALRRLERLE